ncbi:MAG: drug:proton antiporter [Deltaproteobacteria bacterium]|nr:drug:proton antiporter [Deltaproteobacteria bacterium]
MNKKEYKIAFMPSGKRGSFPEGTTILDASRALGVDLDSVCGGRAICGRCQIELTEGKFAKHGIESKAAHLSGATKAEEKYEKRKSLDKKRRLGCQSKLLGNVVIDIPPESQLHQQIVRKDFEATDIFINPITRLYYIDSKINAAKNIEEAIKERLRNDWSLNIESINCVPKNLSDAIKDSSQGFTVAVRDQKDLIGVWPGFIETIYGVAIDIGSTTIAVNLCDLKNGTVISSQGSMNPQIRFGEDLMSRVSYCMQNPGSQSELTKVVREAINNLIVKACSEAEIETQLILETTVVGNPVMHHLFLGFDPVPLGVAPFKLETSDALTLKAKNHGMDIHPQAEIYVLPCLAGHVGADAAAVILTEKPYDQQTMNLIVDVGTNAEIIVGNRDKILAASSPTGPAFEGAQINSGQRAAPGAIERVRIDPSTLQARFKVIGSDLWSDDPDFSENTESIGITGICGSGIIEAVAEMYLSGIISSDGLMNEEIAKENKCLFKDGRTYSYMLYEGEQKIIVTQNDIRAIQLAKAALYAGAKLLMDKLKIKKIDKIRFAGAFGSHIDVKYAMVLGLIPDCNLDEVSSAGNAASTGARMALLDTKSRHEIEQQVKKIEKIETAIEPLFQEYFVGAMSVPHNSDSFDELSKIVRLPKNKKAKTNRKRRRKRTSDL